MQFRKAEMKDIPLLAEMRKRQLWDTAEQPDVDIDKELDDYFTEYLGSGKLVEWLVEEDGEIIATGGIQFITFPPAFKNPTGTKGYITNMYTVKEYRRQGIATKLMDYLIEEARQRGIFKIVLWSSVHGIPMYEKYGFESGRAWMEMDIEL